ncbi:heparinase II/III-family protein [Arthrobacter sp. MAHUQ-56]|nr:heparinase II/III-family protein [Arthrobacter sp. MAHUQ-56]
MPLASSWGPAASVAQLQVLLEGAAARISVPPAADAVWNSLCADSLGELWQQAAAERGTPWPQPLVSHYARYFRDGNRTAYETLVAGRQMRLTRAVVMALVPEHAQVGDSDPSGSSLNEWLDEVIDGVFLLCEQSSWSWAAHDDVFAHSGGVVPDMTRPFLDLGAGEVAAQLAWIDHVLGEQLDSRAPGLRRRIRKETSERVVQPFLERLDWHWLGLKGDVHNWNPWIHTNLIVAALFLVDDAHTQARALARCIEGLDRFLASIPPDGAVDEGFAYWWNGAGRALEGLALLEQATDGVLDGGMPVVSELVAFPHRMHIGGTWFLNVADGPARAAKSLPWEMLYRWARRLGDESAGGHAAAMMTGAVEAAAGLGRVLHFLLARAAPPESEGTTRPPLVELAYLPSVQIMTARETGGTEKGLYLAAKGGHNGEHHNHRDVGSVVIAVDGVPLLVDAGQPTYTAKTFGPDRYQIRAMQSAWHSVPSPFGLEQGTGKAFAAKVVESPTAGNPGLTLALGAAYGLKPENWIRSSCLNREPGAITISDRWELPAQLQDAQGKDVPSDVDITYLTAGTLQLQPGRATIRPTGIPGARQDRGATLRWEPGSADALVDEWHLDDPLLADVWGAKLTRLRFRMPTKSRAAGAFILTVEATS